MASSLTYQLNQQEQQSYDKHEDTATEGNLPSPPHSSCEDEQTGLTSAMKPPTNQPSDDGNKTTASVLIPQQQQRRDSLQSHFSTLTLQAISNSLPANYTIDHSSIQSSLHQALTTTVAAAAAVSKRPTTPIPIEATCRRGPSPALRTHHHLSPPTTSAVATAAATGGLSIRHPRRPSIQTNKHRVLSPPPNKSTAHSLPTTITSTQNYQCDECGKVYKHPSCLTKHRWEHSEEWELTSKLLLTKHQQVQMLEAAAILVSMDPTQSLGVQQMENNEEDEVDILNDDDNDDDIQVDIDDDDDDDDNDMLMEMDQDGDSHEGHTFPSMVGSTPAMLPSSFTTLPLV